tara:strand:+ start:880 stop:1011 length:132 start_codon:yes stop_codon:yes gene_type:complete
MKEYKKLIYIFVSIILISVIGGVARYSLQNIEENKEEYNFVNT